MKMFTIINYLKIEGYVRAVCEDFKSQILFLISLIISKICYLIKRTFKRSLLDVTFSKNLLPKSRKISRDDSKPT